MDDVKTQQEYNPVDTVMGCKGCNLVIKEGKFNNHTQLWKHVLIVNDPGSQVTVFVKEFD